MSSERQPHRSIEEYFEQIGFSVKPDIKLLERRKRDAEREFRQRIRRIMAITTETLLNSAVEVGMEYVLAEMEASSNSAVLLRASGQEEDANKLNEKNRKRFDIVDAGRQGHFAPLRSYFEELAENEGSLAKATGRRTSSHTRRAKKYGEIVANIPLRGVPYSFQRRPQ